MIRLLSVMRTELHSIVTQGRIFAVFFLAILIFAFYYPQPYSGEILRNVAIAVVDMDNTTASRQLVRNIDASMSASVVMKLADAAAAEQAVFERKISGYLFIPKHFERDALSGRQSPVAFYGDASSFLIFSKARSAVSSAVQTMGANIVAGRLMAGGMTPETAIVAASPVRINMIPLFNPEGGYASYVVPAVFLLIFQQILLMGVGLLNTLPRGDDLKPAVGPIITTAGKLLTYMIPATFLYVVATVIVPYFYSIPRIGAFWPNLAIAIPFGIAASAFGLLIAALLRNALIVQVVGNIIGMPLFFLAGIAWPRESIPEALQWLSYAIPSTSGIDAAVRINQMGASLPDVASQFWLLSALAGSYVLLAAVIAHLSLKRERERKSPVAAVSSMQ